jgi:peptidoglycan/xylan/chitin deacetylase (PgdA/CDA1 family)
MMRELETALHIVPPTPDGQLPMTWDMLRDWRAKGMTIGSHSCSHAVLANEPADVLLRELGESRRQLERRLASPVAHFAYPNGSFNAETIRAVASTGYSFAYAACSHQDPAYPRLTIPRTLLWERSSVDASGQFAPAILDCQTYGWLTGRQTCRH